MHVSDHLGISKARIHEPDAGETSIGDDALVVEKDS